MILINGINILHLIKFIDDSSSASFPFSYTNCCNALWKFISINVLGKLCFLTVGYVRVSNLKNLQYSQLIVCFTFTHDLMRHPVDWPGRVGREWRSQKILVGSEHPALPVSPPRSPSMYDFFFSRHSLSHIHPHILSPFLANGLAPPPLLFFYFHCPLCSLESPRKPSHPNFWTLFPHTPRQTSPWVCYTYAGLFSNPDG